MVRIVGDPGKNISPSAPLTGKKVATPDSGAGIKTASKSAEIVSFETADTRLKEYTSLKKKYKSLSDLKLNELNPGESRIIPTNDENFFYRLTVQKGKKKCTLSIINPENKELHPGISVGSKTKYLGHVTIKDIPFEKIRK